MFNFLWRHTDGMDPRNGINWMWNATSRGFVIRIGSRGIRVRWSLRVKKLFVSLQKYSWGEEPGFTRYLWNSPQNQLPNGWVRK